MEDRNEVPPGFERSGSKSECQPLPFLPDYFGYCDRGWRGNRPDGYRPGAQSTITGEIESIGTNIIYIMSGNFLEEVTNARRLTLADAEALSNRSRAPHILRVEPVVQGYAEVAHSGESERGYCGCK